jgi:hypothetical protein
MKGGIKDVGVTRAQVACRPTRGLHSLIAFTSNCRHTLASLTDPQAWTV